MRKTHLLLLAICFSFISHGQITLIGHNMINNSPVNNVNVFVRSEGKTTYSLNTKSKSEFKLQLDYGKLYHIYFQHPNSPLMYVEVQANTIPKEKYEYLMGYEFNVPF